MKRLAIALLALGVLSCAGWNWMQQYQPVSLSAPPAPGGWTWPYSTNDIGTALWLMEGTNTTLAYGSIGSALDNSSVAGVPNHNVVSNTLATMYTNLGTNELGDAKFGWTFTATHRIGINDTNSLSFVSAAPPSNDIPFTLGGWMYATNWASDTLIAKYSGSTNSEYNVYSSGSKLRVLVACTNGGQRFWTLNSVLPSNEWVFVMAVANITQGIVSNGNVSIYTNGVIAAATYGSAGAAYYGMANQVARPTIGADSGGNNLMRGQLAMPFALTNALTALEVTNLSYYAGCQLLQFPVAGGSTNHPSLNKINKLPVEAFPP